MPIFKTIKDEKKQNVITLRWNATFRAKTLMS